MLWIHENRLQNGPEMPAASAISPGNPLPGSLGPGLIQSDRRTQFLNIYLTHIEFDLCFPDFRDKPIAARQHRPESNPKQQRGKES